MKTKAQANAEYYARTRDRIIIHESELRPTAIVELVESIEACDPHKLDQRPARLRTLYHNITGEEL